MHAHDSGHFKSKQKAAKNSKKKAALVIIGVLTTLYCIAELGVAVWTESLSLLSDGFHNLSDVVAIGIAYWALTTADKKASDSMSYGWRRSEIVGALVNGMFLLSLCLYVVLECIPRFIKPPDLEEHGLVFLITAGAGIGVNLLGAVVFGCTGTEAHAHAHTHSHVEHEEGNGDIDEDGHDHIQEHDRHHHKHDTVHTVSDAQRRDLLIAIEGSASSHDIDHDHNHDHDHDHDHDHHDHDHDHSPQHTAAQYYKHRHNNEGKTKHDKGDSRAHKHSHGHGHDLNFWALILHFAGDVVSSVFVLVTGLLMHIYRGNEWLKYLDPVASALIVVIIFASTIGLVRQCTAILMQHVPEHVALGRLRRDILAVPGVDGIRDLHVWELSSDMAVATVHVQVSDVTLFTPVINHIKKLFHQREIHSSTIQPEISTLTKTKDLPTSCVDSCEEDWCCSNNNEIMLTNYKI